MSNFAFGHTRHLLTTDSLLKFFCPKEHCNIHEDLILNSDYYFSNYFSGIDNMFSAMFVHASQQANIVEMSSYA